jgi:uncharacterized Zn-binding protein involved in type VI secretion
VPILQRINAKGMDMPARPVICVGDKTDHGGVVVEGSLFDTIDGRAVARVGDKVTCPKHGCPSTTAIATGDPTTMFDGKEVARHGDKTACGATLIASQFLTTVEDGPATAPNSTAKPTSENETPQTWRADPPSLVQAQDTAAFDHQFVVHDKTTGKPAAGFAFGLKAPAGDLHGKVADDGATTKAHAPSSHPVELTYLVQTEIGVRK